MNSTIRACHGALLALFAILLMCTGAAHAENQVIPRYASVQVDPNNPTHVDIALVLAVDVSSSIKPEERRFQREAYAQALSDPRVAHMALGGRAGRVAIAYMEWSGRKYQRLHQPMRVMATPAELAQFGQQIAGIEDVPGDRMFLQRTAIGDALLAAEAAIAEVNLRARDYVIDISGDGVLNDGVAVFAVREQLLAMGLTVNGLPIEVSQSAVIDAEEQTDRVTQFYMDCVIGGPGSFHVVARGFGDVRETLIMKLMLELADMAPLQKRRIAMAWNTGSVGQAARIIPATAIQLGLPREQQRPRSDCGEFTGASINPFQTQR